MTQGQVGTLCIQVRARIVLGTFHRAGRIFVFHDALGILRAARRGATVYGDQHRQRDLHRLDTAIDVAADRGDAILDTEDFFGVGHLVETEFLGHLRTDLGGIAVDGLTAAEDDVNPADLLDGGREGIGGSEGVSTGEEAVGQQPAFVSSAIEAFTYDFSGTGRAHREHADGGAGVLFFQSERLLEGVQVVGIEDGRKGGTVDRSFGRHRIFPNIPGVRHLFGQDHNFQTHAIVWL